MRKFQVIAFLWTALACSGLAFGQKKSPPKQELPAGWTLGPASLPLNSRAAQLDLPKGFIYLDTKAAQKFLTDTKQPPQPNLLGMVVEPESKVEWYALITYEGFGHVNDDGANESLKESDKLLEGLKKATQEAYAKLPPGSPPAPTTVGWYKNPVYSAQTHTINTTVILQEAGAPDQTVNFTTIILGRYGGLSYTIVGSKHDAAYIENQLQQLDACLHFTPGKDYASWQSSDGTSDVAFTSLITGGAAVAVAAKTGLLAKFGSFLLTLLLALKKAFIAVLAAGAGFVRWIKSKFSRQPAVDPAVPNPDPPAGA